MSSLPKSLIPFLFKSLILLSIIQTVFGAGIDGSRWGYNKTLCYTPFADFPRDLPCYVYSETKPVAGAQLSIHYRYDGDIKLSRNPTPYLNLLNETAETVLSYYSKFLPPTKPLDIRAFVVGYVSDSKAGSRDEDYGNSWTDPASPDTCFVELQIYTSQGLSGDKSFQSFRHTIAHQLYHCVQFRLGQLGYLNPSLSTDGIHNQADISHWWYEGAADYFANALYPIGFGRFSNAYDPRDDLAGYFLTGWSNGGIFFMHLSNLGWSDNDIHRFILEQKFSKTRREEVERMTNDTRMIKAFRSFATSYVDRQLKYKDGTPIDTFNNYLGYSGYLTGSAEYNLVHKGSYDLTVKALPFVINPTYTFTVAPGQKVSVNYTNAFLEDEWKGQWYARDTLFVQWRKDQELTWQELKMGEAIELQGKSIFDCSQPNTTFTLLTTSSRYGYQGDLPWPDYQRSYTYGRVQLVDSTWRENSTVETFICT